ncbi:Purine permease 1 [Linum perenne]
MQVQFVVSMFATLFCTLPMIINKDFQVMIQFAGIITSLLVPVQQVFAVITLREGFNAEKGMALALCLWGFTSHLYGGYKKSKEATKSSIEEDHDSHDV